MTGFKMVNVLVYVDIEEENFNPEDVDGYTVMDIQETEANTITDYEIQVIKNEVLAHGIALYDQEKINPIIKSLIHNGHLAYKSDVVVEMVCSSLKYDEE